MGLIHALLIGLVSLLPAQLGAPVAAPAAPAAAQIGWCSHENGARSVECTLADQDGSWTCTCQNGGVTTTCTQPGGVSINACEFRNCCQ